MPQRSDGSIDAYPGFMNDLNALNRKRSEDFWGTIFNAHVFKPVLQDRKPSITGDMYLQNKPHHGLNNKPYFEDLLPLASAVIDPKNEGIDPLTGSKTIGHPKNVEYVPYQLCPKCDGKGKVYLAPTGTGPDVSCPVCNGRMVIPMHKLY